VGHSLKMVAIYYIKYINVKLKKSINVNDQRKHLVDMMKHGSGCVWSTYDQQKMFQSFFNL
jgi:hypothetical protein